jgi:hypothetical protein
MQWSSAWVRAVVVAGIWAIGQPALFGADTSVRSASTIKDVMVGAFKEKLANRVIQGEASEAEKERLLTLYEALAQTAPPRGSRVSWQRKTGALVDAAQAALDGEPSAPQLLKKTMECGACHTSHK